MFYGFRLNDQKEWTKIKTFSSPQEFIDYVSRRRITTAKLIDEATYQKYYTNHAIPVGDET